SQSLTDTSTQQVDPIDGLRAAADQVSIRTKILYSDSTPAGFLKAVAAAAHTSDFVIAEATAHVDSLSRLTKRFPKTRFLVPDSVLDPAASFGGQRNVTGVNFDDRE